MMQPRHPEQDENEQITRSAFQQAREVSISPSPYLETRVLAELREARARSRKLVFWKTFSVLTAAVSFMVVGGSFAYQRFSGSGYRVPVNEAMVVRVELEHLDRTRIAFAEIDLPPGVYFYSKAHPELNSESNIKIAWNPGSRQTSFPFAIEAKEMGKRVIYVRFLNDQGDLVAERALDVQFVTSKADRERSES